MRLPYLCFLVTGICSLASISSGKRPEKPNESCRIAQKSIGRLLERELLGEQAYKTAVPATDSPVCMLRNRTCCSANIELSFCRAAQLQIHRQLDSLLMDGAREDEGKLLQRLSDLLRAFRYESQRNISKTIDKLMKAQRVKSEAYLPRDLLGWHGSSSISTAIHHQSKHIILETASSLTVNEERWCIMPQTLAPSTAVCLLRYTRRLLLNSSAQYERHVHRLQRVIGRLQLLNLTLNYVLRSFNIARESLISVPISESCAEAMSRMHFCSRCQSDLHTPRDACYPFCQNVYSGCWWPVVKRLKSTFGEYIRALVNTVMQLHFTGIESDWVENVAEGVVTASRVSQAAFQNRNKLIEVDNVERNKCNRSCVHFSTLLHQNHIVRRKRFVSRRKKVKKLALKAGQFAELANDVSDFITQNGYKILAPPANSICEQLFYINKFNTHRCWNGSSVARYTHKVREFSFDQLHNPEVNVLVKDEFQSEYLVQLEGWLTSEIQFLYKVQEHVKNPKQPHYSILDETSSRSHEIQELHLQRLSNVDIRWIYTTPKPTHHIRHSHSRKPHHGDDNSPVVKVTEMSASTASSTCVSLVFFAVLTCLVHT